MVAAQLGDVSSWEEFQRTPVTLDVDALVPPLERAHLDALPASVRIHGDAVALEYAVRDLKPVVRVMLREGQARRLREGELPSMDRPIVFAVRKEGAVLSADTIEALREQLDRAVARKAERRSRRGERNPRDDRDRHRPRGKGGGKGRGKRR
jgi:hypothetical protein